MDTNGKIENGIISVEKDNKIVFTLDLSGRFLFYDNGDATYRRSLDNKFLRLKHTESGRSVELVDKEAGNKIADEAYNFLGSIAEDLPQELSIYARRFSSLNHEFLEEDAKKLHGIYGMSVPIVPPDQYFPVYIQAEKGCSWNRCTFCKLYRDRDYMVRLPDEFKEHVRQVKDYFGEGLSARKTVFLGDANAVNLEQKTLLSYLDLIKEEFGLPVYAFVDAISTQKRKSEMHFREMKDHGLKRVYLGLESGDPGVLRLLNKMMNLSEAINLVNQIKDAGLNIGIILMAGAGGRKFYENHVKNTASVISQMDLGRGDIIYISPIYEFDDADYYNISKGLGSLDDNEKEKQIGDLKTSIYETYQDMNGKKLEAPIVKYDLKEAIY
ncbi:oxygen-independent coproporphyrinogen III oxidase [Thermoplasma volcanium GSS1]|uniref:Oxygen-independent coproporphyrinogen III oxidase n=1 Tax=Thermoplasma volcanium (strain ATCC 51530 / DSM 4299 / JCM 9571 / NBRC 15438 / GSS1) TaxID=273116 RepID=Q97A45_THEVO|nr:radical SAM protein [Thermoplasma volcanium]BAB60107.1 oxygen-independent coproporphyrinogen III oxidase [Thermoplasma volcanium GSS1]